MDSISANNRILDVLAGAAVRIFKPLVRILLKHGVSYKTCAEWLRWCYVDVAQNDFAISGRKQTKSRIAVLTGLTRIDVDRLLKLPSPQLLDQEEHYHRAARVLHAWRYDPDYQDEQGQPLDLDFDCQSGPSFTQLVEHNSGGTPPRAVMDELQRIGCIEVSSERRIRLIRGELVTADNEEELVNLVILNMSAGRLMDTISHNILLHNQEKRLQLMVLNPRIRAEKMPEIKQYLEEQGRSLIMHVNEWLDEQADDVEHEDIEYIRTGLGVYYFEEQSQQDDWKF